MPPRSSLALLATAVAGASREPDRSPEPVREAAWPDDRADFASSVAAAALPTVFRGGCHATQSWSALQWTAGTMSRAHPGLPVQVQWSRHGYFMFVDEETEAEGLLEDTEQQSSSAFSYTTAQVPLSRFVQNMTNAGYHRLTGLMNSGGSMDVFLSGVQPYLPLVPAADSANCSSAAGLKPPPNAAATILSFWMASAGVTTHTHFDVDHNFFVQLNGEESQLENGLSTLPSSLPPSLPPSLSPPLSLSLTLSPSLRHLHSLPLKLSAFPFFSLLPQIGMHKPSAFVVAVMAAGVLIAGFSNRLYQVQAEASGSSPGALVMHQWNSSRMGFFPSSFPVELLKDDIDVRKVNII